MRNENIKLDAHEITSQGFLVADAYLTRAGIFDYMENGKLVREYRPENEVFDEESLNSIKFNPLSLQHPSEFIDTNNLDKYHVGMVGDTITREGSRVKGRIVITDKVVIDRILKGEVPEISMGYNAEVVDVGGEHPTEGRYDKTQTKIRYNHAALVDRGRAGRSVRLIMDAMDAIHETEAETEETKEGSFRTFKPKGVQGVSIVFGALKDKKEAKKDMADVKIKAVEAGAFRMGAINGAIPDEAVSVVNSLSAKLDEAVEVIRADAKASAELQGKHDAVSKELTEVKAQVDELSNPASASVQAMLSERKRVEDAAASFGVPVVDNAGKAMDSRAVKCAVITKTDSAFNTEGKSEDYIAARFDAVVEIAKTAGLAGLRTVIHDAAITQKTDHRAAFVKDSANLWKNEGGK